MSEAYLGIDGGGSKTEFALCRASGEVLDVFRLPGSNAFNVGAERCVSILREGVDRCLRTAPELTRVFAGLAGIDGAALRKAVTDGLTDAYPALSVDVGKDTENVLGCAEGDVALICGTGSAILVRTEAGLRTIGAWGHLLNDPCSGYSIGREGLIAVRAEADGCGPKTSITQKLCAFTGRLPQDVSRGFGAEYVKGFARCSEAVFEAYREGDGAAREILFRSAAALSRQLQAATRLGGRRVIACGGVIEHNRDVLLPLLREMNEDVEFVFPDLPPVYGACAECLRRAGLPANEAFHGRFYAEYTEKINEK